MNIPRPRRHWGRRKGPSLSARQAGLLDTLLPKLMLTLQAGRDPQLYFPERQISSVWLEVGFGGGEHLLWQAQAHKDTGIIGAEPYISGVAKLIAKVDTLSPHEGKGALSNVRIYMEDAHDIVAALPDASLSRVFVLFPDPWPKTRHHKRRFLQTEMLNELARVMVPGAELRFATDDCGYLIWVLERFMAHRSFAWLAKGCADWRTRPADWPKTRYEAKAIGSGRACTYLRFQRVG